MLKRKRKINKAKLIEYSRRHRPQPATQLPLAYAALLAAGVPEDKALLMVRDAATRDHSDSADVSRVVLWSETPYEEEWCKAMGW